MRDDNMCKQELMKKIMDYKFAINDIALYLDTQPCDSNALAKHNEYVEQYNTCKDQYTKLYGPLSIYEETDSWDKWVYEPWPWERSAK